MKMKNSLLISLITIVFTITIVAQEKPIIDTSKNKSNHNTARTTVCCSIVFIDDTIGVDFNDENVRKTYQKYLINQRKSRSKKVDTLEEYKKGLREVVLKNAKVLFSNGYPKTELSNVSISMGILFNDEISIVTVQERGLVASSEKNANWNTSRRIKKGQKNSDNKTQNEKAISYGSTRSNKQSIKFREDTIEIIIDDTEIRKEYSKYVISQKKAKRQGIQVYSEYKNELNGVLMKKARALFPNGRPKVESGEVSLWITLKYKEFPITATVVF